MTNISAVGKRDLTRARLLSVALDLFDGRGYDNTTVAQIAAAAGVAEMTYFRHFATKDAVLVDDPYDPVIASVVAQQPRDLSALERTRRGFEIALAQLSSDEDEAVRRRLRIVAAHPDLRASTYAATQATHAAVVAALIDTGTPEAEAEVAVGACLGALTAALLHWGGTAGTSLGEQLRGALSSLAPGQGEVLTDGRR